MSIWKSPVFYFGILLVLAVATALVAPFVVDWNAYKPDLQAYGRKLTSRDVSISGPVQVRLFPWPRLEAENVTIANPKDFGKGDYLSSDKIVVRLSLAGLFNGSLDVEAIELDGPQLVVVRNKRGDTNWRVAPDQSLAVTGLLNRVKFDQIVVHRGSVWFEDEARQYSGGISKLEARLSASAIEGPWKLIGNGEFRGEAVDVTIGVASLETGKPLKLTARVVPKDNSIPAVATEGEWTGELYKGVIRIDPNESADQKQSAEGRFRPLKLQASVEAGVDQAILNAIKIAPADSKDSGTLIEGNAKLDLSTPAHMQLVLASPRINLDTLLGAGSISQWRDGGLLAVANSIFATMPENLTSDVEFGVNVLTSGGDTLNNVLVKGIVERQDIGITEAVAELPGRSTARFDGIIFPGEGAAELKGSLQFQAGDFRTFLGWLAPERKPGLEAIWKGSRGRLALKTEVDWTQTRFGMSKLQYEFDGAPGEGEMIMRLGQVPGLDLTLKSSRIDLDELLPQGFAVLPSGQAMALSDVLAPLLTEATVTERHVRLETTALVLNGVTANNVALDATMGLSGLEIKSVTVGDVDGAKLSGNGLILKTAEGPSGTLHFSLAAENPVGFLRLTGLVGSAQPPGWSTVLGKTSIGVDITATHEQQRSKFHIVAKGSSGPLLLDVGADLNAASGLDGIGVSLLATIRSADGSNLARLAEIPVLQADATPGQVTVALNGDWSSGFGADITANALAGAVHYKGRLKPGVAYAGLDGELSATATSLSGLRSVFGIPFEAAEGTLDLASKIRVEGSALKLSGITGQIAGSNVNGDGAFDAAGKFSADVSTGPLRLPDVVAAAFLAWDASPTDTSKSFADPKTMRFPMEVFIHPSALETIATAPLTETVIGYGASPEGVTLSLRQPGPQAQQVEMILKPLGASYDMSLHGRTQLDLAKLLGSKEGPSYAAGMIQLDGKARGEGRSPAAVLASLAGGGTYWLSDARLSRLTIVGFPDAIQAAATQENLTAAFNKLEQPPGTAIGERTGSVSIANGVLALAAFGPAATDSNVTVTASVDLTEAAQQVTAQVGLRAKPDIPPVTITYSGSPGAVVKRSATAALVAKLGYELLAKEMAELEALQKQQAALAAQEELQRKEDEQRFASYQETREELRKRLRERRVFAAEQDTQRTLSREGFENALQSGDALNRADLVARVRVRAARQVFATTP